MALACPQEVIQGTPAFLLVYKVHPIRHFYICAKDQFKILEVNEETESLMKDNCQAIEKILGIANSGRSMDALIVSWQATSNNLVLSFN